MGDLNFDWSSRSSGIAFDFSYWQNILDPDTEISCHYVLESKLDQLVEGLHALVHTPATLVLDKQHNTINLTRSESSKSFVARAITILLICQKTQHMMTSCHDITKTCNKSIILICKN